jgi:ABC-type uncharacterized transport system permease subunit
MAAGSATMPAPKVRERPAWMQDLGPKILALLVAFVIALVLGGVIILLYGERPLDVYRVILEGSFSDSTDFGRVLEIATPLIFSALAVAVCFKAGLFNIGVEGQYLVAMITASIAALYFDFLPAPLHVLSVLVFAMLGGMIWAAIPAVLKVKTGAHEVVTTIMLNGIAISLVAYSLNGPLHFTETGQFNVDLRTDRFPSSALIPDLGHFLGIERSANVSWLLPLGILAAVMVWFLIKRMRLGYEARAVGSSAGSAQAGGISVGAVQIKLFLISGALAGLVGMQQILADKGYFPQNYEAQLGFTGIAVAFLGQNNPIGIVFAAIVWGVLSRGESALQLETEVPREFMIILEGILIMSVVITYQLASRRIARRQMRVAGEVERLDDAEAPVDIEAQAREDR